MTTKRAQSIGIPFNRIWVIVWCVAGVVALVAGMIWGSKVGCAVFTVNRGLARIACGDFGRLDLGARRHHWWLDHRCGREIV